MRCFACIFDSHGAIIKIGVKTMTHLHRLMNYVYMMQSLLDRGCVRHTGRRRVRQHMASLRRRCATIVSSIHSMTVSFLLGKRNTDEFR